MVAKINKCRNLFGVLLYNQEKVDQKEASVLFSQGVIHNEFMDYNVKDCAWSFENRLAANKKTENPVVHISLNPDPKDLVDDEVAKEIAQEYLNKMGYGEQPYLLYKHEDIERTHYHIVTVCVNEHGKKISSNFEKRKSMEACREIEKKYNLHIPTKLELKNEYRIQSVDRAKGNIYKQIRNTVGALIESYNVTSFSEYRTLLEQFGCTCSQVDGRIPIKDSDKFKPIHGIFYSAIDENKKANSRQLKSSLFGKEFGYEALQRKFKFNEEKYKEVKIVDKLEDQLTDKEKKQLQWKKNIQKTQQRQKGNTDFTRRIIVQSMYQCKNRSKEELRDILNKRGIDMILFTNTDNRIYGTTFIDHNTKAVIKGSRLGDEFAANSFSNFFNNPFYVIPFPNENKGNEYSPTKVKENRDEEPFESVYSLFSMPEGADPDEYIHRKKKKKTNNNNQKF